MERQKGGEALTTNLVDQTLDPGQTGTSGID
jgi:hypothetical protein